MSPLRYSTCFVWSCKGVRLADFELSEELTKPWKSIYAFQQRYAAFGAKGAGWGRMLLTLTISVSVLLQGVAFNTLGYPKERWLPDHGASVTHPVSHFEGQGLDWTQYFWNALGFAGGGPPASNIADALIAGEVLSGLPAFRTAMLATPLGWQSVERQNGNFPVLDTRYTAGSGQGLALQQQHIVDVFLYLKSNGSFDARAAKGWSGMLTMEVPSVTADCGPYQKINGTSNSTTVNFRDAGLAAFELSVDPLAYGEIQNSLDAFDGANCVLGFRRVRYPFSQVSAESLHIWPSSR